MTPASLIGPIAAATIVNVFLFAAAWNEQKKGHEFGHGSWSLIAGLMIYGLLAAFFVYARLEAPIANSLDLFGAAAVGEAVGALVVYATLHSLLFSRGRPIRERVRPALIVIVVTAGVLASLLARLSG